MPQLRSSKMQHDDEGAAWFSKLLLFGKVWRLLPSYAQGLCHRDSLLLQKPNVVLEHGLSPPLEAPESDGIRELVTLIL